METLKKVAFIPARAGSLRVKSKNIRILNGHPLIAYSISAALQSNVFDRVIVSTDSEDIAEIAKSYGAEVPFIRPASLATSVAVDAQWLKHAFDTLAPYYFDIFSILRPTSPFRSAQTINRAMDSFVQNRKQWDSLRAVNLVKEHPGKMWTITENGLLEPLLSQDSMDLPWHARQYQDLPKVYVQNSSLEIANSYVIPRYNSREGKVIGSWVSDGLQGFSIDYEEDFMLAEMYLKQDQNLLPEVRRNKSEGL